MDETKATYTGLIGRAVAGGNAGLKIAEKVNKKMND